MGTGPGIPWRSGSLLTLPALVCLAVSCQPDPESPETLPELPSLRLEGLAPEVRKVLSPAQSDAVRNSGSAMACGSFAMHLHAYELREQSVAAYRRAAAIDPQDWRWSYYLGTVLADLGRHGEAGRHLRKAVDLAPDSIAARVRLGTSLLGDGRSAESLRAFEGAVGLDPHSAAAHYGLGRARALDGDRQGALHSYSRAIEIAPDSGAPRYALAMLYQSLDRPGDATRQLELAGTGREEPPLPDPLMEAVWALRADRQEHLLAGRDLENRGLLEEAVQAYGRAVEADADYALPHINLVSALGKLERFEDAARHYRRALALAPDSAELHVNWGTLLARTGRPAEAAGSFRRAIGINPHSGPTHADLAWALEESGNTREALAHYRKAVELDPAHRAANFRLARELVREGNVQEAIVHLRRTLEPEDERTPTYLYGLADAHMRIGETGEAMKHLRRAAKLARAKGQTQLARDLERDLRVVEAAARR